MNYARMYAVLCAACSEAIDALDARNPLLARHILQRALYEAEDLFIEEADRLSD